MTKSGVRTWTTNVFALGLIAALIIMLFAFVNGYALFFNDSRSYVRGPALAIATLTKVNVVPEWQSRTSATSTHISAGQNIKPPEAAYSANRSIYYGALAFIGYITSDFWLTIFLQALAVGISLSILSQRSLRLEPKWFLVAIAITATTTSLGPITALIMPDIFAAVLIVSVATVFALWYRLTRLEIFILLLLTTFAALAHPSHMVLLAGLLGVLAAIKVLSKGRVGNWASVAATTFALVLGLAGQIGYAKALEAATGASPVTLPHITAHLQETDPGYAFLKANCPQGGYAVCGFMDRLPMHWEAFIGADPVNGVFAPADLATKRRLSEEQIPLAIAVFRHDPLGLSAAMARDLGRQLARFSLIDLRVTPEALRNYRDAFPSNVATKIANSMSGRSDRLLNALTFGTYVATVLGALVLIYLTSRRAPTYVSGGADFNLVILVAVLGVAGNAAICAILASPYDRFQTRVIWLVPALALLGLFARLARTKGHGDAVDAT